MLAVVKATEHFRVYLLGRQYTLRTDHSPISGLAKSKLEIMRVERWAMRLSEYEFNVEVVNGRDNVVADALSRIRWLEGTEDRRESPPDDDEEFSVEYAGNDDITDVSYEYAYVELERETVEEYQGTVAPTFEGIRADQVADAEFAEMRMWVQTGVLPLPKAREGLSEFMRACIQSFSQLQIVSDVLVLHDQDGSPNQRALIPPQLVTDVIKYIHEGRFSAHDSF